MSEEHHRVQQTLLVRGNALAKLQADLKAYSTRQGSFALDVNEQVQATKLPPYIIHPLDKSYQQWSDFLLLWVLYTAWVGPFEFAFVPRNESLGLTISDSVSDFFFICDLVITFFVAYYDKNTAELIVDQKQIGIKYLRSFFLLDLLSCIPFRSVLRGTAHGTSTHLIFRILGLLRLWRLRRLSRLFAKLEKNIRINYFWTRTVKFVLVIILAAHFAGCFFYFLATTYPVASQSYTWIGSDTDDFRAFSLYRRYITSLYFAVVTLTTVGYGDYSPQSVREISFAIFYIIFSMGLTAYVIGNITALIQKSSARTLQYRQNLKDLHTYCVYNNLPASLRSEMVEFMQLKFRISEKRRDVLDQFPRPIRARVAKLLHRGYLEGADLFQGCSPEMLEQMEADVEVEYFMPNDILLAQKDIHPQLYILTAGILELSVADMGASRAIGLWRPGQSVGDVALLCGIPQPFTCKAIQLCRVLAVKRQVFKDLLQSFPQDAQQMASNLLKTIRTEDDQHLTDLADEVSRVVARKEEEMVVQLCAAAATGDLRTVRQLMLSGIDPNAGDFDGRRPIHVAAAMGYDDCVRFLISNGADVNVRDKFDASPLSEALRLGQHSTAELLREHGADVTPRVASYDLCTAVASGNARNVALLLAFGADPNCFDFDGKTPLQIAATLGNQEVVNLLLRHGAQFDATPSGHIGAFSTDVVSSLEELERLRNTDSPSEGPHLNHVGSMRDMAAQSAQPGSPQEEIMGIFALDGRTSRALDADSLAAEKPSEGAVPGSDARNGRLGDNPVPNPEAEQTFEPETYWDSELTLNSRMQIPTSTTEELKEPESPLVHPTPVRPFQLPPTLLINPPVTTSLPSQASVASEPPPRTEPFGLTIRTPPPVSRSCTPPLPSPGLHRTPLSSPQLSLRSDSDVPSRYREKESEEKRSGEVLPLLKAAHQARNKAQSRAEARRVVVHPLEAPEGRALGGGLVLALEGTRNDLLRVAETEFGYTATRLLDESGAEIRDVSLLRDGDHIYLAGAATLPIRPGSNASVEHRLGELHELMADLQRDLRALRSGRVGTL
ncbi:potassium channel [Klebsormidium nitens]|uniref:Potassium channel n=1 Tax=Klebsormidium nitens TaxID=105231 RepID=A0A0U9HKC7_KLENI|nr:potassium channel [Klebsormidium nitens]|eukprot:GAQ82666.1 potassium channel [Klebsormidium nitens]